MDTPPAGFESSTPFIPSANHIPNAPGSQAGIVEGGVKPIEKGPRAEVPALFNDPIRAMRQFLDIYEKEGSAAAQFVKDSIQRPPPVSTPGVEDVPVRVRTKFKVTGISPMDGQNIIEGATITLMPVSSGSKENEDFYKWTPGGSIQLSTVNGNAARFFVVGTDLYVDFIPA